MCKRILLVACSTFLWAYSTYANHVDATWYRSDQKVLHIGSGAQLRAMAWLIGQGIDFNGQTLFLDRDITVDDGENWLPIGDDMLHFQGEFDGRNKRITLKSSFTAAFQNSTERYIAGFFGCVGAYGYIHHLILQTQAEVHFPSTADSDCAEWSTFGMIAADNRGAVRNCFVSKELKIVAAPETHVVVGGIVGRSHPGSTVRNCTSDIRIDCEGVFVLGGVVGWANDISLSNCCNGATLCFRPDDREAYCGGVVGKYVGGYGVRLSAEQCIVNCMNYARIDVASGNGATSVGGIAGAMRGRVRLYNSANFGSIDTNAYASGGIVGLSGGNMRNCYNTGKLHAMRANQVIDALAVHCYDYHALFCKNCYYARQEGDGCALSSYGKGLKPSKIASRSFCNKLNAYVRKNRAATSPGLEFWETFRFSAGLCGMSSSGWAEPCPLNKGYQP